MTETVSSRLIDALNAAGIPAFPEYPQTQMPVPAVPCFVTAACAESACSAPVDSSFGEALPLLLTVRLRLHCRTDCDAAGYAARTDACILHAIREAHFDLRGLRQGELHYVKQLDRLVQETNLSIGGTLYPGGEGSS